MVVQSDESHGVNISGSSSNDGKQRLRQRFQVIKKLGQGTYGKVQLAINKETKQEVAIKTIRKAKIENEQDLLRIRREIQIMSSIQHPHIIHIYEVFENSDKIVLVMQYASGGELYDYLGCHKKLLEKEARRIFRQIAAAIYYCHKNKVCHRDLKLENILLDDKGNAKIADFGLSNVFDDRKKLRTFCGSPLYASPEIVKGTPYCGPEVDCWSLGVLLYTLVYGAMPFDGSNFKRLVKQISEGDYYEPKIKSKASGIIRRLLTVDVVARATIKDICNDEWVNETYDHSLLKVANDMACLTPVSMNSLPSLRRIKTSADTAKSSFGNSVPSQKKNNTLDRDLDSIMKLTQNELTKLNSLVGKNHIKTTCYNSNESNSDLSAFAISQRCDGALSGNYVTAQAKVNSSTKDTPKPELLAYDTTHDFNNISGCDVSANHCSETTSIIKRMKEKEEVTKSIYLNSTEIKCKEFASCQNVETIDGKSSNATVSGQREEMKNKSDCTTNEKVTLFPENIPNCAKDKRLHRQSAVEQFRAWRASLDEPSKNESDSILPIFNVTSVIPKRSSEKQKVLESTSSDNDQLEPNGPIRTKVFSMNASCTNGTKEGNLSFKNSQTTDASAISRFQNTECGLDSTRAPGRSELTAPRERKEVIEFLNQICSQRKISTEMKKQFVSALKTDAKNDVKLESASLIPLPDTDASCVESKIIVSPCKEHTGKKETVDYSCTVANNVDDVCAVETTKETPQSTLILSDSQCVRSMGEQIQAHAEQLKDNILHQAISADSVLTSNLVNLKSEPEPIKPTECTEHVKTTSQDKIERTEEISHLATEEVHKVDVLQNDQGIPKTLPANEKEFGQAVVTSESFDNKLQTTLQSYVDEPRYQGKRIERKRQSRSHSIQKLKTRSCSVDNDERMGDLEKILRRPRKYSLCALLAASFELERLTVRSRSHSESSRKLPGKVTIPRSFDPSSESEASTPIDKKEIILIPTVTVAENKQKIENKIEKVKLSALSMKPRRKSDAGTRRKLRKYTRSCTDVLQRIGNFTNGVNTMQNGSIMCNESSGSYSSCLTSEYSYNDGNKTDSEIECHYGVIRFLDQEEQEECTTASKSESSEIGNSGYVPITRCCKKITFPPKCSDGAENITNNAILRNNYADMYARSEDPTARENTTPSDPNGIHETMYFKSSRRNKKKAEAAKEENFENNTNAVTNSENDQNKDCETNGDKKSLQSSESLNSSSLEKDSSDNDDEFDPMSFDSKLEEYESEDLWKFLKSINNDLSFHLKKVKKNAAKSMYARSKSQECRSSEDHAVAEKSLTRSRSKEEKQNDPINTINSYSSQETCESSSLSDINQTPSKDLARSLAHVNEKAFLPNDPSNASGKRSKEMMQDLARMRYYSLNNLDDSQSFLYENSIGDMSGDQGSESFDIVSFINGARDISQKKDGKAISENSSLTLNRKSLYGTLRPKQFTKGERSQSYMTLNGAGVYDALYSKEQSKSLSHNEFRRSENERPSNVRSKALSDLDLSYRDAAYNSEFFSTICNADSSEHSSMKFSKSLGSKLNLEPRSILLESSSKRQTTSPRSKLKNDALLRKRARKVSFIGDTMKEEHTNFALESIAKAQMALNNVDREFVADKTDEDKETLLEALKTHGYKTIMSQRLQQNDDEEEEGEILNRRYSLARMLNLKNYNAEEIPFNFAHARNTVDASEYSKRVPWNRNFMCSLDDVSGDYYNTLEYSDLLSLNGVYDSRSHAKTDVNWCQFPNTWLYQNVANLRPYRTINDDIPLSNWDEVDFNFWQKYGKSESHCGNSSCQDYYEQKTNQSKARSNVPQNKCFSSELEPQTSRNAESPIEKLSFKIKALKNRCQQKSFDESTMSRSISVESIENPGSHISVRNNENIAASELSESDKPGESVSDRIWRKSFYSRFNDTPTLRRRRSMMFDPDYSQDSCAMKSVKLRNTSNSKEFITRLPEKESVSSLAKDKRIINRSSFEDDVNKTSLCPRTNMNEQNIPEPTNGTSNEKDVMHSPIQGGE